MTLLLYHFILSMYSFSFAHVLVSQNGHCLVPTKSTDHPELSRLGRWVTTQRSKNTEKGEGLETEKKRKLNEIGFIWRF
jgi:hypothetical protein